MDLDDGVAVAADCLFGPYNRTEMSLITRCPACTTMFRVVPDQLRVSGGWVRCGHCQEVFDASANLQPAAALSPNPTPSAEPDVMDAPASDERAFDDIALEMPEPIPAHDEREPFLEVNPRALHMEYHAHTEPALESEVETAPALDNANESATKDIAIPAGMAPSAQPSTPSFVSRRQPRARSGWATAGWAVMATVLLLAMGAQVLVHERDRIAAIEPASLQVLGPLCAAMGCTIGPYRQVESVVIDSSAFSRLRGDVYRLAATYKNTAAVPIEAPALELTLTDLQDQPVVRRVFTAKELGLSRATLDAGAEQAIALPVALKLGSAAEKISGYRLLAFYP